MQLISRLGSAVVSAGQADLGRNNRHFADEARNASSRDLQQAPNAAVVDETLEFSMNFAGYRNREENGAIPVRPNPTIAAGRFSLVSATKSRIEIRFKDGGLASVASLSTFFSPANRFLSRAFNETFDHDLSAPKVIWDAFGERYIVIVLNDISMGDPVYQQAYLVYGAISRGPDPLFLDATSWKYFVMDVSDTIEENSSLILRPRLPDHVTDGENLYLTCSMNDRLSFSFVESRLWVLNKEALFRDEGNATSVPEVLAINGAIYGIRPSNNESEPLVASNNETEPLVTSNNETEPLATSNNQSEPLMLPSRKQVELSSDVLMSATSLRVEGTETFGPYVLGYRSGFGTLPTNGRDFGVYCVSYQKQRIEFDGIRNKDEFSSVIRVSNVTNGNTDPVLTSRLVSLGDIDDDRKVLPNARQPGLNTHGIDTGKRRAIDAVWHEGYVWFVTPVRTEKRSAIYWAKIRAPSEGDFDSDSDSSDYVDSSVEKSGYVTGLDVTDEPFVYNPSIAINACDRVGIGFSLSSTDIFPSSYAAFLNDRYDDEFGDSRLFAMGLRPYNTRSQRRAWSRYSGCTPDFEVPSCLWFFNQYSTTPEGNSTRTENENWATHYSVECSCAEG